VCDDVVRHRLHFRSKRHFTQNRSKDPLVNKTTVSDTAALAVAFNPRVNSLLLSKSIAQRWLANFHDTTIYLVIDRTDINADHWLLFVGLCYRGRAFPLVWKVLPGKGSTSFVRQRALLRIIEPMIDKSCTVVLLGDREFRSTALMGFCQRRGWHFRGRLKCDIWIRANRRWFQLRDLSLKPGERRYFHQCISPVNVGVHFTSLAGWILGVKIHGTSPPIRKQMRVHYWSLRSDSMSNRCFPTSKAGV